MAGLQGPGRGEGGLAGLGVVEGGVDPRHEVVLGEGDLDGLLGAHDLPGHGGDHQGDAAGHPGGHQDGGDGNPDLQNRPWRRGPGSAIVQFSGWT